MIIKRPFGAGVLAAPPAGAHPAPVVLPAPPARCGNPAGAACSTAERGAARFWLVLDRRLRMGEGSASGRPWGDGPGKGAKFAT